MRVGDGDGGLKACAINESSVDALFYLSNGDTVYMHLR